MCVVILANNANTELEDMFPALTDIINLSCYHYRPIEKNIMITTDCSISVNEIAFYHKEVSLIDLLR